MISKDKDSPPDGMPQQEPNNAGELLRIIRARRRRRMRDVSSSSESEEDALFNAVLNEVNESVLHSVIDRMDTADGEIGQSQQPPPQPQQENLPGLPRFRVSISRALRSPILELPRIPRRISGFPTRVAQVVEVKEEGGEGKPDLEATENLYCGEVLDSVPPVQSTDENSKELPRNLNFCAFCDQPGDLACGSCYRVVYCTQSHQEEDWSNHQTACTNFSLRRTKTTLYQGPFKVELGTKTNTFVMKAPVRVPKKEKILEEAPVLMSPWPRMKLRQCEDFSLPDTTNLRVASLTCFGCCYILEATCKRCPHCNLPLCLNCKLPYMHTNNECNVVKNYRRVCLGPVAVDPRTHFGRGVSEEEIEFFYQDVMMVRLILYLVKEEEKEFGNKSEPGQGFKSNRWIQLLQIWNLYDNKNEEEERRNESMRGKVAFTNLGKVFPYSLFLLGNDTSLVWTLFCILEANAFTFNMPYQRFNVLCSLLPKTRHSCFPNCHAFLTYRQPETPNSVDLCDFYSVTVISGRVISKGESITISYIPLVFNVMERRLILLDKHLFWCYCSRCTDPSEKGTYTSSTVCQQCRRGYCVPPKEYLKKGPGPIPNDIHSLSAVRQAEDMYKISLTGTNCLWRCSHAPVGAACVVSGDRKSVSVATLIRLITKQYQEVIDQHRLCELSSIRCLGKYEVTVRFRTEHQRILHNNHAVFLKLNEDILRGDMYSLLDASNATPMLGNSSPEYCRSIAQAFEAFEAYMHIVNPAFDFQGYPMDIINQFRDDFNRRGRPGATMAVVIPITSPRIVI